MGKSTGTDEAAPFIVTTPASQSFEGKRNVIRRHVMRGKNRKKPPSRPPSWMNSSKPRNTDNVDKEKRVSIPPKVGNDFSLAAFSAEIGPGMLEDIWKLKHAMVPAEFGLVSNQTESSFFEPVLNDTACLHFTLFTTKVYMDSLDGKKEISKIALVHLVNALAILQQRLAGSDKEQTISDSTILVVVGLTMTATALGDLEAAQNHLRGLFKMVMLRGGISAFKENRSLQPKIFRADIGVALATGCKPLFFSGCVSWDSYIPSKGKLSHLQPKDSDPDPEIPTSDIGHFLYSLDARLRSAWDDLAEFSRAANIATQCKLRIDTELYQEVMVSIHYRLANLRFDAGSIDETIRLTLLSFSSTLFLQWRGTRTRFEFLSQNMKTSVSLLKDNDGNTPAPLMLWIYIVGAVSVFDEQEQAAFQPDLIEVLRVMKLKSWNQVTSSLKSVIWVDVLHDSLAKQIVLAALPEAE
ncbi:hypothetical protein BGZ61DRAFT_457085 [Ilyonectria robusta]|uniref:uncharacterized protein n=1 Tax=Ilyonectria robusta TaxID=1079257 RepID=UPI001E8D1216|nr:uncharacterized protein BGZ61DRAFT_457085 [Ilyonectria robusta]KAH8679358.1 hypothetical protein BGZ61DRAFT_457085 [Ilyonectria robusta]